MAAGNDSVDLAKIGLFPNVVGGTPDHGNGYLPGQSNNGSGKGRPTAAAINHF